MFMLGIGIWFQAQWFLDPHNPLRHEALIGVGLAILYGIPFGGGAAGLAWWKGDVLGTIERRLGWALALAAVLLLLVSLVASAWGN
jgi:hypothetical protein